MKYRREIKGVLFSCLSVLAIIIVVLHWEKVSSCIQAVASSSLRGRIIVRNLTGQTVDYEVKFLDSNNSSIKNRKRLNPGGIEEFHMHRGGFLTYLRLGNDITEYLVPKASYCFRYDEYGLAHLYLGSHMMKDVKDLAPYIATPLEVAERMLEMADAKKTDILFDLGCGDGRIVILAAKKYGAKGIGVDMEARLIKKARLEARKAGIEKFVKFRVGDAMKTDFAEATIVALYLLPESNALLKPQFEKQLKPGVRIVSHDYIIPDWEDRLISSATIIDRTGKRHTVFLYQL